ncbi:MAG: BatD family protein [Phycisphaerales bacterium JB043]
MRSILTLIATLILTLGASAQNVRVQASVSPQRAQLGDPIHLEITVREARSPSIQNLSLPRGVQAGTPSPIQNSQTSLINGRVHKSVTTSLIYPLSVRDEGTYTIPAQTVVVDGNTYTTDPVTFSVTLPPVSESNHIVIEPQEGPIFVGQPFGLRVKWYLRERPHNHSFQLNLNRALADVYRSRTRGNFGEPINFEDAHVIPDYSEEFYEGVPYYVLSWDVIIVPKVAGNLFLGPASATFKELTGYRTRGFIREPSYSSSIAQSETITIDISPLPPGAPDSFDGLVGPHVIATEVSPNEANVGDPLTLRVKIAGDEPLERIEAPSLDFLADSFRLSNEGWSDVESPAPDLRIFETTIRATTDSISELPPIELAYFDPAEGEYHVANSRPFPLTIHPTRQITAQDAIVSTAPGVTPSPNAPIQTTLALAPMRVRANRPSGSMRPGGRVDLLARITTPVGIGVTAAPPLLYALSLALVTAQRRRNPARVRQRAALKRALPLLQSGKARLATQLFLAEWFDLEPDAVTSRDARVLLEGKAEDQLIATLETAMERLELAPPDDTTPPPEVDLLQATLTTIHKGLLRCD